MEDTYLDLYTDPNRMVYTDPSECSVHGDKLAKDGSCHKCNTRLMFDAAFGNNVRRGNIGLAIAQYRILGN